jgi:hypothetical protein
LDPPYLVLADLMILTRFLHSQIRLQENTHGATTISINDTLRNDTQQSYDKMRHSV